VKEIPATMLHQYKQNQEILQGVESVRYIVDMMIVNAQVLGGTYQPMINGHDMLLYSTLIGGEQSREVDRA
jgi:hypothetical protein